MTPNVEMEVVDLDQTAHKMSCIFSSNSICHFASTLLNIIDTGNG